MKKIILFIGVLVIVWACGERSVRAGSAKDEEFILDRTAAMSNLQLDSSYSENKKKQTSAVEKINRDSIYPREFTLANGQERYRKIYSGIYVYEKSYSKRDWDLELVRIDFYNSNGQKINEFDIRNNNPYTKGTIPTLEQGNYQSYVYDSFVPLDSISGESRHKAEKYHSFPQIPSSEGLPVVGYHLLAMNNYAVVDWKFTAVCLDERGNVLRIFKDLNIDPYAFCLSENKKFFCVGFGGLRGEDLTRLRNNGLRIYEIETGKLVYELKVDAKHSISGPGNDIRLNQGGFSIRGNDFSKELDRTIFTIDFDKREIYKRLFTYEEQRYIRGADSKGYIMLDEENNRRWKLFYNRDFTIEKF